LRLIFNAREGSERGGGLVRTGERRADRIEAQHNDEQRGHHDAALSLPVASYPPMAQESTATLASVKGQLMQMIMRFHLSCIMLLQGAQL